MVIRHRFSAPAVLAFGAFLAGAIGVASALTPEMADRSRLVRGVLPPGVPDAARMLALAFGILLIWLSLGLARRKYRAWKLGVALVIGSAVLHLVKGLDFEETTRLAHAARRALVLARRVRRPGRPEDALAVPAGGDRPRRDRRPHVPALERPRRLLGADRGRADPGRSRPGHPRALPLAPALRAAGALLARGARRRRGARARRGARLALLLRASPRQELLLLAERPLVHRVRGDQRQRDRERRPDRRARRVRRAPARVQACRARPRLASRDRQCERGARFPSIAGRG